MGKSAYKLLIELEINELLEKGKALLASNVGLETSAFSGVCTELLEEITMLEAELKNLRLNVRLSKNENKDLNK